MYEEKRIPMECNTAIARIYSFDEEGDKLALPKNYELVQVDCDDNREMIGEMLSWGVKLIALFSKK